MATTTIQLDKRTRAKLSRLKASPRETYDELLNKLMLLVPEGDDEGKYKDSFRAGLLEAMVDVRLGRTIPLDQVKKRLGL